MEPPDEFPFPFQPYPIQHDFMRNLYLCIENNNLGIFESPTGTGKSLSLICGALKWLVDHEKRDKENLLEKVEEIKVQLKEEAENEKADDWLPAQLKRMEINAEKRDLESKLAIIREKEGRKAVLKKKIAAFDGKRKSAVKYRPKKAVDKNDELENFEEGKENPFEVDFEADLLLDEIQNDSDEFEDERESDGEKRYEHCKIFICSRTHSQLSQFVGELRRSPYADKVSLVSLASRQNYCLNKEVQKLRHVNLMNERCLQLQKKKTTAKEEKALKKSKVSTSCKYLPGNQEILIAEIVTEIREIEDIVLKGKELETCAYYASRNSIENCDIVLVPYNTILHKNTRTSLGIDLKGNVLIIDEAHNLLDAIERMHSATITGRNILHCYSQLAQYQKRFQSLFSAKNALFLNQLNFCLKKLVNVLGGTTKSSPDDKSNESTPKLYTVEQFESMSEIDTINIFNLLDFIKTSKLMHKLQGYVEKYGTGITIHHTTKQSGVSQFLSSLQKKDSGEASSEVQTSEKNTDEEQGNNPLMMIVSFLECLKSNCADGRIFVIPGLTLGQSTLKYLLLNPATHFHDIVRDSRAVILAGGTMEPISEFTDRLFLSAGAAPERIVSYSCDHVVPKENVSANIVSRGPSGVDFEFNYQNRKNTNLLNELGRALLNLCNIVPQGIVVFLASYDYENLLYAHLKSSGVIEKIQAKKRIFREPKLASQVSKVLEQYARAVRYPESPQNGSLIFSVVGGKLSEGLNFSDELGRCVVVVGMPYPNVKSPELQEKMKYLNENKPDAGNVFYENLCMKAVNQCVGRAVRHINDYSTVILLDKRYRNKVNALPRWIQRSLTVHESFGSLIGSVAKFFAAKKKSVHKSS